MIRPSQLCPHWHISPSSRCHSQLPNCKLWVGPKHNLTRGWRAYQANGKWHRKPVPWVHALDCKARKNQELLEYWHLNNTRLPCAKRMGHYWCYPNLYATNFILRTLIAIHHIQHGRNFSNSRATVAMFSIHFVLEACQMDSSGPVWRIQRETRSQTFNLRSPCYCKLADFVRNFHSEAGFMFSEGDKKILSPNRRSISSIESWSQLQSLQIARRSAWCLLPSLKTNPAIRPPGKNMDWGRMNVQVLFQMYIKISPQSWEDMGGSRTASKKGIAFRMMLPSAYSRFRQVLALWCSGIAGLWPEPKLWITQFGSSVWSWNQIMWKEASATKGNKLWSTKNTFKLLRTSTVHMFSCKTAKNEVILQDIHGNSWRHFVFPPWHIRNILLSGMASWKLKLFAKLLGYCPVGTKTCCRPPHLWMMPVVIK